MTIFCFEHRELCIVVLKKKRGNKTPYKYTPHTHKLSVKVYIRAFDRH